MDRLRARRASIVYLTGFMGSGKSTLAPVLANALGYSCRDIDAEIQDRAGTTVRDIFAAHGEEYFRRIERRIVREVSARAERCVVALGGGTIADETNLRLVKTSGILVYLKVDPEQILHRLRHKTDRPLLIPHAEFATTTDPQHDPAATDDQLRERIKTLLDLRAPYYAQADLTIATDEQSIGATVDALVRSLRRLVA